MKILMLGTGLAALALAGCSTMDDSGTTTGPTSDSAATAGASAMLRTATGADAGRATVSASDNAMTVNVVARGLPAGVHGIHVHAVGKCEGPAFTTAGPHWNPSAKMHGTENPMGPHHGDLPNITIAADGTGTLSYPLAGGTLDGLLDADGASVVIHAKVDDYRTDPSGNSGDRIACGVLARP